MKWRFCCMNCRTRLSSVAQMGDFVVFRGGECGRFWAASGVSFAKHEPVCDFSGLSVRPWPLSGARWAEGKKKKVHPTRKVQSDEPKIENMDGCLTKSEHGVGAFKRPCASVVSRGCGSSGRCRVDNGRRTAASDGKVLVFGRKRGRLTGGDYCLSAYGLYRLA